MNPADKINSSLPARAADRVAASAGACTPAFLRPASRHVHLHNLRTSTSTPRLPTPRALTTLQIGTSRCENSNAQWNFISVRS